MDRLTERNQYGVVYFRTAEGIAVRGSGFNVDYHMKHHPDVIKRRLVALDKAIDRLAAYEDTGLTPEDVEIFKHFIQRGVSAPDSPMWKIKPNPDKVRFVFQQEGRSDV